MFWNLSLSFPHNEPLRRALSAAVSQTWELSCKGLSEPQGYLAGVAAPAPEPLLGAALRHPLPNPGLGQMPSLRGALPALCVPRPHPWNPGDLSSWGPAPGTRSRIEISRPGSGSLSPGSEGLASSPPPWAQSQLRQLSWVPGHIWVKHPRAFSREEESGSLAPIWRGARHSLKKGPPRPSRVLEGGPPR